MSDEYSDLQKDQRNNPQYYDNLHDDDYYDYLDNEEYDRLSDENDDIFDDIY